MDAGSRHPRLSRLAPWIVGILTAATASLILSTLLPSGNYPYVEYGCLHSRFTDPVKVGDVATVQASVTYEKCTDDPTTDAGQDHQRVPVGGRARLDLKSALTPVTISPLSEELLPIDSAYDFGEWQWSVRADEPGDHNLTLVLTIFEADGKTVKAQKQKDLLIHAEGTAAYYAGAAWRGVRDFATSTQTIILALAAVFGTMAGALVKIQRHRKKAGSDDASGGSRGGYI